MKLCRHDIHPALHRQPQRLQRSEPCGAGFPSCLRRIAMRRSVSFVPPANRCTAQGFPQASGGPLCGAAFPSSLRRTAVRRRVSLKPPVDRCTAQGFPQASGGSLCGAGFPSCLRRTAVRRRKRLQPISAVNAENAVPLTLWPSRWAQLRFGQETRLPRRKAGFQRTHGTRRAGWDVPL